MYRVCVIVAVGLVAAGCNGSSHHARSPHEVEAAFRAAGLAPHRITYELRAANAASQAQTPTFGVAVQASSDEMLTPLETLEADDGNALVTVFSDDDEARRYDALMPVSAMRVRNVVARGVRGRLSPDVRAALSHLR